MDNLLFAVMTHRWELMIVVARNEEHAIEILKEETFAWRKIVHIGFATDEMEPGFISVHSDLMQNI